MKGIDVYESEFPLMGYIQPRKPYMGILDSRWMLVKLGFTREFIMEWLHATPKERQAWVSMARQVSPGFQNRGHRRAVRRAFNTALQAIWNAGSIARIEVPLHVVRRYSDFSAS